MGVHAHLVVNNVLPVPAFYNGVLIGQEIHIAALLVKVKRRIWVTVGVPLQFRNKPGQFSRKPEVDVPGVTKRPSMLNALDAMLLA